MQANVVYIKSSTQAKAYLGAFSKVIQTAKIEGFKSSSEWHRIKAH